MPAELLDSKTKYHINPTGRFVVGGPQGDTIEIAGRQVTCTSPRITAHIQTLLSSPISTSPMTWALTSTNALGSTRGEVPR